MALLFTGTLADALLVNGSFVMCGLFLIQLNSHFERCQFYIRKHKFMELKTILFICHKILHLIFYLSLKCP